jgi:copper chaperone
VVLRVDMTCDGCVQAVKRILGKTEGTRCCCAALLRHCCATAVAARTSARMRLAAAGVESYEVDLALKKVTVRGAVTPEALVERVSKMGKDTALWAQ